MRPPAVGTPAVCILLVAAILTGFLVTSAVAQEVLAGYDLFETDPATTDFDFNLTPIPADFFGPGSDPFDGVISLDGSPLGGSLFCPDDDLSQVSTIVRRLSDAHVATFPSSDPIQIEIVELSLVSVDPIVVTENGGQNPELWDVEVELSQNPQPQGQMTINRTHANGGTFDADLPVLPKFIFTRQSDSQVQELDFGLLALPPVGLGALGVPWENWAPPPLSCTSNWCVNPGGGVVQFVAINATHGVVAICPVGSGIPTLSTWMAVALFVLFIITGAVWMRRRARAA
jgi:hypothetical protein